jgi:hypothetical protein
MRALVLLILTAAATCQSNAPAPPAPAPDPWPEAAAPPMPACADSDLCCQACAVLARLGCEEARPSRLGASCMDVCKGANDTGVVPLPTGCVARASDVAAVRTCGVRCAQ